MHKELEALGFETDDLVDCLAETFISRRDLYARQLDDGRYICVRKPLLPRPVCACLLS